MKILRLSIRRLLAESNPAVADVTTLRSVCSFIALFESRGMLWT